MTSVSERLQNFESINGDVTEASANERTSTKKSTLPGTYGSRRRRRSNDNRVDLSDDEMDMDPKRTQQQVHEATEPPLLISQSSEHQNAGNSSEPPKDLVDLDLIAKSMSTTKTQSGTLPLTKDEIRRNGERGVQNNEGKANEEAATEGNEAHLSRWSKLARIFKNPLAHEKERKEELVLKLLKENDSGFSEEAYQIDKHTQDTFINTKKEEAESVRMEKELRQAERDAKNRKQLWEKIVRTTMSVIMGSVEVEKRQQEQVLLSHLRAMDSSVDEDDIRRQKEAQELFVEMKRREAERQRILQMEEVEKQRRDAMLAENMRLPEGLQNEDSSLMMQNSIILQGAKIQEALRSSLFQVVNFSEDEEGEAEAPPVPLHIQRQLQQALLLQQLSENPDIEIDEEALRHSREIQESLVDYAKKNPRQSWLESFMPRRPSVPEEVAFDDAESVGSRVSWLSGGFGGGGISRSWRSSFSKQDEAEASEEGKLHGRKDKDKDKNGLRTSWQMWGNNQSPKVETNLHMVGHAEESQSSNSDL